MSSCSSFEGLVGVWGISASGSNISSVSSGAGASPRDRSSASRKSNASDITDSKNGGLSSAMRSTSRRFISAEAGAGSSRVALLKLESEAGSNMAEGASTLSTDTSRASWDEKELSDAFRFKSSLSALPESSKPLEGDASRRRFGNLGFLVEGGSR